MFLKTITLIALATTLSITVACKNSHSHPHDHNQVDTTGVQDQLQTKEYSSAYVCPMHCKGSGSDQPGKCPVCNMDYVVNDKAAKDHGHDHDHGDHEGHDHN